MAIFIGVPFVSAFAGAFITGLLLRRLFWPQGLIAIISFSAGVGVTAVLAAGAVMIEPQYIGIFILGAAPIFAGIFAGTLLGTFAGTLGYKPASISKEKPISVSLALGILIFPYVFAWRTLGKEYSKKARYLAFGWLVMFLLPIAPLLIQGARLGSGDYSACPSDHKKLECWSKIAVHKNDPAACEKFRSEYSSQNDREDCMKSFAEFAENEKNCVEMERLGKDFLKAADSCYAKFPGTPAARCDLMFSGGHEESYVGRKCWNSQNVRRVFERTGHSVLQASLLYGYDLDTSEILALNPDMNHKAKDGRTILHMLEGDGLLEKFIEEKADPNIRNASGLTAPMVWVADGHLFMLKENFSKRLVDSGWKINETDAEGNTILHLIASSKSLYSKPDKPYDFEQKVIQDLIEFGADPKLRNRKGQTPMDIAKSRNLQALFQ